MKKALKSEEEIKEKISNESWMGAKEVKEYFEVNLLETENKAVACVDKNIFKNYKNVPENLKNLISNTEEKKEEVIDYSEFEKRLKKYSL